MLTRPEHAFSVNKLSQFMSDPTQSHWITCKRVLRYLKNIMNMCLRIKKSEYFDLTAYTNADWASDPDDRRSISGYCVYLGNNLVTWSSRNKVWFLDLLQSLNTELWLYAVLKLHGSVHCLMSLS